MKTNSMLEYNKKLQEWKCIICWANKPENEKYRCFDCYINWYWDEIIEEIMKNILPTKIQYE